MNSAVSDVAREAFNLDELVTRCMGNVSLAARVLTRFQTGVEKDLERLEEQLASGNAEALALVAHRIKGASANVSAPLLHEQAAEIERLGREGSLDGMDSRLSQLRDEWRCFLEIASRLELMTTEAGTSATSRAPTAHSNSE